MMDAMAPRPLVIALGGGGFSMEASPLLDDHVLAAAETPRPRVLFVPTASGDAADYVVRFYRSLGERATCAHLELFRRTHVDLRALVMAHDVVYVGGGNTASMLAVWRVHGLDRVLREAHAAGVVMAGISAGAVCWFQGAITDSYGATMEPLDDGLGLLPGVMVPHYDGEAARRPALHREMAGGRWSRGWAADDGAALVFHGEQLIDVVASRPGVAGYRIQRGDHGEISEHRLAARLLG